MKNQNWLLITPLVVLYAVGIAGIWAPLYIPPLAALAVERVNESWLGFVGNIIGAVGTLIAAFVAWVVVQHQIRHQEKATETVRKNKEFAARAVLPLSLSALHSYATRCVLSIEKLPDHPAAGTVLQMPLIPFDDVSAIRDALEYMEREPAKQLAATLMFLQIQQARLPALAAETFDGLVSAFERQCRLRDAITLVGLIDRSFDYARGSDYVAADLEVDEFDTAFRKYASNDISSYKIIEAYLSVRRDPKVLKLMTDNGKLHFN